MAAKKFAAMFALLALSAPAHAATIEWTLDNVTGDFLDAADQERGVGAENLTGYFDYNTSTDLIVAANIIATGPIAADFTSGAEPAEGGEADFSNLSNKPAAYYLDLVWRGFSFANSKNLPLSSASSIALFPSGGGGVSLSNVVGINISDTGEAIVLGGNTGFLEYGGQVSVVPLPAAFPLFGTALAGLGGIGWLKRRAKVSRKGES